MAHDLPRWRIVLVEDSSGDVCLFQMALKEANLNAELVVLSDGAEALSLVRKEGKYAEWPAPDMIVLDKMLPKASGSEVLRAIRASEDLSSVPVVLMTGIASAVSPKGQLRETELEMTKPLGLQEYLHIGTVLKDILQGNDTPRNLRAAGS